MNEYGPFTAMAALLGSDTLAIDPGTYTSGVAMFNRQHRRVTWSHPEVPNESVRELVAQSDGTAVVAIEMIASYGMPVGYEVFETCVWIGRFQETRAMAMPNRDLGLLVYRKEVGLYLCNSPRAKPSNIRQALIDLIGKPGTKASPGPTYGVTSHAWDALAVAAFALKLEAL